MNVMLVIVMAAVLSTSARIYQTEHPHQDKQHIGPQLSEAHTKDKQGDPASAGCRHPPP